MAARERIFWIALTLLLLLVVGMQQATIMSFEPSNTITVHHEGGK